MLNVYFHALEQAATPEMMGGAASVGYLVFWAVAMILMFYLVVYRPQKKKETDQKKLRDNLQIGDEVSTIGGIVGIVVRRDDKTETVVIETGGDRSKIRIKMWAISENLTQHDAQEEEAVRKK